MGKIVINSVEYLEKEKLKSRVIYIQDIVLQKLDDIFVSDHILELHFNYEIGIGERGHYLDKENFLFSIKFNYFKKSNFEFYLYYDQLEYYISNNNKILKSCNLEDYTEDINEMAETFIKYLIRDMEKLNIPYQDK